MRETYNSNGFERGTVSYCIVLIFNNYDEQNNMMLKSFCILEI